MNSRSKRIKLRDTRSNLGKIRSAGALTTPAARLAGSRSNAELFTKLDALPFQSQQVSWLVLVFGHEISFGRRSNVKLYRACAGWGARWRIIGILVSFGRLSFAKPNRKAALAFDDGGASKFPSQDHQIRLSMTRRAIVIDRFRSTSNGAFHWNDQAFRLSRVAAASLSSPSSE